MRKRRRTGAAFLVGLCGIAIVAGARLPWVTARGLRPGSGIADTSVVGLMDWVYEPCKTFVSSFAATVIVAGLLVFLGGLFASRFAVALFAFLGLAFACLWIALNASHFKTTDLFVSDLRIGALLSIGGAILALITVPWLRRRSV